MTDPFRLRVLKNLTACLEEITPENGYHYNFSGKVFRGRLLFGDSDPDTMLTIIEPPLPSDPKAGPEGSATSDTIWNLIVQGFLPDDKENPTDPAHLAMADVKKRLAEETKRTAHLPERGFAPLNMRSGKNQVVGLKISPGVVRPPEGGVSNKAYFWLSLSLKIVEDNSDPFG